jgi:hypothetical protein
VGWGGNQAINTISRWFRRYLGRDLNAKEVRIFGEMLAQGTTLPEIHVGILASTEYFDRAGNRPAAFVRNVFEDVVGRAPTRLEQATWTTRLRNTHRNNRYQFARDFLATFYRG